MLGRKGCWTLPQLMMELESKVKTLEADTTLLKTTVSALQTTVQLQSDRIEALENAHYYAYQHALHCTGSDETNSQTFYLTLVTDDNTAFTGATLTEYLLANDGAGYNATGYTADDDAVVGLEIDDDDIRLRLPNSDSSTITNITVISDTVTSIQVK